MTEVEKTMAARRVWIYDLQGEGDKGYDNEMQVFSNEEACRSYFVKMYGKRIYDWDNLHETQDYAEFAALEDGKQIDFAPAEDDDEVVSPIEEMVRDAMIAYGKALDNLGGHTEHGYTFRVIKTDLIDDVAELWD